MKTNITREYRASETDTEIVADALRHYARASVIRAAACLREGRNDTEGAKLDLMRALHVVEVCERAQSRI